MRIGGVSQAFLFVTRGFNPLKNMRQNGNLAEVIGDEKQIEGL